MLIIHILYGFKLKAEDRKSLQHVKNNLILNITLTKYYIKIFIIVLLHIAFQDIAFHLILLCICPLNEGKQ